ncbi:MAG: YdcF family protein [Blautia sp.]|nr:YdcF family protein [Blautia sp.]
MYREFLKQIGDFIFIEDEPENADIIFVPGNGYPQMAELAAKLYREGYSRYLLPSGKYSITEGHFSGVLSKTELYRGKYETEWEFLEDVLVKNGVPRQAILKEDQATFTYENAVYSRQVTDRMGLKIHKAILCCKNTHARRALMYYKTLYPDTRFLVCPAVVDGITGKNWTTSEEGIQAVTGETTRIIRQFSLLMEGMDYSKL